jgi:hypothetical protein
MYMLAHLEPSVALTGGPWYTDNELDTEFIKLLNTACLRFIQDNVSIMSLNFTELQGANISHRVFQSNGRNTKGSTLSTPYLTLRSIRPLRMFKHS